MNDQDIIERIAELWIELGGDSERIEYCWMMLRDRVKEIEDFEKHNR